MHINDVLKNAQEYAKRIQCPSGAWRGVCETNLTIEAEMLLFNYFLGIQDDATNKKLIQRILNLRNTDGTWKENYFTGGGLAGTLTGKATKRRSTGKYTLAKIYGTALSVI